jgi:hypothetical protein
MALNGGFTASAVRKYRPAFEKIAQWASAGLNQEYSNSRLPRSQNSSTPQLKNQERWTYPPYSLLAHSERLPMVHSFAMAVLN